MHEKFKKDESIWEKRPLSDMALRYAIADVEQLGSLSEHLLRDLKKKVERQSAKRISEYIGLEQYRSVTKNSNSLPPDVDFWLTFDDESGIPTYIIVDDDSTDLRIPFDSCKLTTQKSESNERNACIDLNSAEVNGWKNDEGSDETPLFNDDDFESLLDTLPIFASSAIRHAIRHDERTCNVGQVVDIKVDTDMP
eukprot:IDg19484t1